MFYLLTWEREPFNGGVTYVSDYAGYSITANYSASNPLEFESDAKNWQLFDHNGRVIKSFGNLEEAQNYAEILYENIE